MKSAVLTLTIGACLVLAGLSLGAVLDRAVVQPIVTALYGETP